MELANSSGRRGTRGLGALSDLGGDVDGLAPWRKKELAVLTGGGRCSSGANVGEVQGEFRQARC